MEARVSLRAVEAGRVRIGWGGFALALPEKWNLSLHSPAAAMERRGLLVFSDLRGPAFEIRWQMPRRLKWLAEDPRRALGRVAAKLRGRGAVEEMEGGCWVRDKGLALVAGRRHLYELHCPRQPEQIEAIARDFAGSLALMADGPWLWAVYGIAAWLPSTARLREIALRTGDCRLTFALRAAKNQEALTIGGMDYMHGGGRVTLAGHALAHQILRQRSLRHWAAEELTQVRDVPGGTWEEAGDWATWRATSRRLGRRMMHQAHIQHDAVRNRICWTHVAQCVKTG